MAPPETQCGSPALEARLPSVPPPASTSVSSCEKDLCASLRFSLLRVDGRARTSVVRLPHGDIRTPIFMPVGTHGAVKGLTPDLMYVLHNEMIARERAQAHKTKKRKHALSGEKTRNDHPSGDKRNADGGARKVEEMQGQEEERREREEEISLRENISKEEKKSVETACPETGCKEEESSDGKKIRRDCSSTSGDSSDFPYPNHTYLSHEQQRHRTSSLLLRSSQTSLPSNSFPSSSSENRTSSSASSSSSSSSSTSSLSGPLSSFSSTASPSCSSYSSSSASSLSPSSPPVRTPCGEDLVLRRPPASFSPIILGNTFHLYLTVGVSRMQAAGGLHPFMRWGGNLLTDSGGFQMVSLFKIIDVKEEGVEFDAGSLVSSQQQKKTQRRDKGRGGRENRKKQKRPLEDKGGGGEQAKAIVVRKGEARSGDIGLHQEKKEDDESLMVDPFLNTKKGEKEGQTHEGAKEGSNNSMAILLTPEKSIHMQNAIGSDIIMQLDDVVSSTTPDPVRVEEAMHRSLRWLDRCIAAHNRPADQALFGIVQGGLNARTRTISLQEIRKRPLPGFAIGGLSGGEAKDDFWKMVELSTRPGGIGLPENKPRYLMGVGYPVDVVVCVALGCDMFDCVYPCRTARFGTALARVPGGVLRIKQNRFKDDLGSLDPSCGCYTCRSYSRAFLHATFGKAPAAAQLLTIHNLFFMQTLCTDMQRAIEEGRFSGFVREFIQVIYPPPPSPQIMADERASSLSSSAVSPDTKKSLTVQREDDDLTGGKVVMQRGLREHREKDKEVRKKEEDDQRNGLIKKGEGEDKTRGGGEEEGGSQEGDPMKLSDFRANEKENNTSPDTDQRKVEEDSMSPREKKKRTKKREGKEENMKTGVLNVGHESVCRGEKSIASSPPPLWVYEALQAAGIDISDLYKHFTTEEPKTTTMPPSERP